MWYATSTVIWVCLQMWYIQWRTIGLSGHSRVWDHTIWTVKREYFSNQQKRASATFEPTWTKDVDISDAAGFILTSTRIIFRSWSGGLYSQEQTYLPTMIAGVDWHCRGWVFRDPSMYISLNFLLNTPFLFVNSPYILPLKTRRVTVDDWLLASTMGHLGVSEHGAPPNGSFLSRRWVPCA